MSHSTQPTYSVVVPFYNEEGAAGPLLAEVKTVMEKIGAPYEVLAIDDGSLDRTVEQLSLAARNWPACRVISMERNQGQAAALLRGFAESRGAWIITMDGDGQNAPGDIPSLIAVSGHFDMVVGIRATRRDTWLRRAMSRVANTVRGSMLGDYLKDSGCALKIFRREVAASFWPIRSLYSFMPAFAVAGGFCITEIAVEHRERRTGISKYGFGTFAWRPLLDMLSLWWLLRKRPAIKPAGQARMG
ncbi:glycosyltransferase family 2 protein [Oleiharenicola lentus]|uniref:glycosyltransferase family 2 protein n=1 Tax=Oleiharenicola lentus TaxID=2508720 RepID=UPI003F66BB34